MQQVGQVSPDGRWFWDGTRWVPTPPQPQAYAPAVEAFESAAGRANLASIFIGLSIAGIGVLAIANLAIDLEPANPSESQDLTVGLLALVGLMAWIGTYVTAIVFFCMWLHRVVRNMPALGSPDPRWTPARAVGYCFVPFLNFVHPLWSVLDAWRGSDASRRVLYLQDRAVLGTPPLLVSWWVLWLGGLGISRVSSNMTGPIAAALDVASGLALMGAAVLLIQIVRRLTARQDHKQELIASGALA
jgi:hypothetical protein